MGRWKASFGLKSFEVHPTNSQSVSLPIMGFKYIKGLPPIHKGPLRPSVGIMTHLVMGDLLIYPFSLKEPTHTYRDPRSNQKKDTLSISLVCSTMYLVLT